MYCEDLLMISDPDTPTFHRRGCVFVSLLAKHSFEPDFKQDVGGQAGSGH